SASAWGTRGRVRIDAGDSKGGVFDTSVALELDPAMGWSYVNRGCALTRLGEFEAAQRDLDRGVDLVRNDPVAWLNRGFLRCRKGELDGARADLDRALELDPDQLLALANRAWARRQLGDLWGAFADRRRILELTPECARNHIEVAEVLIEADRAVGAPPDDALLHAERATQLEPLNARAWWIRARAHEALGRHEPAIACATWAIELVPQDAVYRGQRGLSLKRLGELAAAERDYDAALEIDPRWGWAYDARAIVRARRGEVAGAEADWARAFELEPKNASFVGDRAESRIERHDYDGA